MERYLHRETARPAWARVRATLALTGFGAAFGVGLGCLWEIVIAVQDPFGFSAIRLLAATVIGGVFGAFSGGGFALGLMVLQRRQTIDTLAPWRAGLVGFVVSAAFPTVLALLFGSPERITAPGFPALSAFTGSLGALLSTSLVAVARRQRARELGAVRSSASLRTPDLE